MASIQSHHGCNSSEGSGVRKPLPTRQPGSVGGARLALHNKHFRVSPSMLAQCILQARCSRRRPYLTPILMTLAIVPVMTSMLISAGLGGLGAAGDLAGGLTYGPPPSNAASDLGLGLTYGPPPSIGGGMGIAPLSGSSTVGGLSGGLGGSGGMDYGPQPPHQTGARCGSLVASSRPSLATP